MNKLSATHNASDVYQHWLDKMLAENPEYWTMAARQKKRKREFLYRRDKNKIPEEVMNFTRWLKIVELYFLMARKEVIQAKRLRLGHRLGAIQARTISRNFKKKMINWGETMKQPVIVDEQTGKKKRARIVYHTSEVYSRIAWEKLRSIPNEPYYKFVPSQGGKNRGGFQRDFIIALDKDPLLRTQFKQFINELI